MVSEAIPVQTTSQTDLERIMTAAVSKTAIALERRGFRARADGTTLYAQRGSSNLIVRNHISPAPPGTREAMLEMYTHLVVEAIVRGRASNRSKMDGGA